MGKGRSRLLALPFYILLNLILRILSIAKASPIPFIVCRNLSKAFLPKASSLRSIPGAEIIYIILSRNK